MAGATGKEESSVQRGAEEQACDAPRFGRGEESDRGAEARRGDNHSVGNGRQVSCERRGPDEALWAPQNMDHGTVIIVGNDDEGV